MNTRKRLTDLEENVKSLKEIAETSRISIGVLSEGIGAVSDSVSALKESVTNSEYNEDVVRRNLENRISNLERSGKLMRNTFSATYQQARVNKKRLERIEGKLGVPKKLIERDSEEAELKVAKENVKKPAPKKPNVKKPKKTK